MLCGCPPVGSTCISDFGGEFRPSLIGMVYFFQISCSLDKEQPTGYVRHYALSDFYQHGEQ